MERGDVYLVSIALPNRTAPSGTALAPRDKYVVVLRGGTRAASEPDVPVVIASTDRRSPGQNLRPFDVAVGTAEGFSRDTIIDCRWPYTLQKARLPLGSFQF